MANPSTGAPANPLDQLRDIHLPEPISWWPMAPGWWILIIGGAALVVWLIRFFYRRHSAKLYRRQALEKLHRLKLIKDSQQQLRELFELLKQTAISAYPNRHPSSKSIDQFIVFLQRSCDKPVFDKGNIEFEKALYSSSSHKIEHSEELFEDAKIWVKQHIPEDRLELDDLC